MWLEIVAPDGEILLQDAQIMARTKQDPRVDPHVLCIWAHSKEEAEYIVNALKKNPFIEKDYRARIVTDEEHRAGMPEPPVDAGKKWWRDNYPIAIPSHSARRARGKAQSAKND